MGFHIPKHGNLDKWAYQGVLLLNSVLSVEQSKPNSHANLGWEVFTDNIIKYISDNCKDTIFILWGSPAISKTKLIDRKKHHILTAPNPSPLRSYIGFFGCKHFYPTNNILNSLNKESLILTII